MRSLLRSLTWVLACAALAGTCGDAAALGPGAADRGSSDQKAVRMLAGGGRIWEGADVSRPTADITFSGHIDRIGAGNTTSDFRCRWSVRFQDVQGTQFDEAVFTATECRDISVWAAGGAVEAAMRVVLVGTLNGVPGYSLVMNAVDVTEPGAQDQIRFRLFLGEWVPGAPEPLDPLYDTDWEFTEYPDTQRRTYLDAGNLQSKVDSPWP